MQSNIIILTCDLFLREHVNMQNTYVNVRLTYFCRYGYLRLIYVKMRDRYADMQLQNCLCQQFNINYS